MKPSIAKICLIVSGIFLVGSSMILCACPGLDILAAVFAGISIWAGTGRQRKWAIFLLVLCLIATWFQTDSLIRDQRKVERIKMEIARRLNTNAVGSTNSPSEK
ncbi:MAG TPA: hypothetical protein VGO67_07750 [Verrucomicrobiae bacterium]